MKFEPAPIENIRQILPLLEGKPEFIVIKKDWYTVIDYVYQSNTTFDHPYLMECRGIKFCSKTGDVIARPYHKFHNLGEKEEYATENVNLVNPHVILDKLDGSMVHTCKSPMGNLYLMTRKGITEVAEKADKFLMANSFRYTQFFDALGWEDYTYIFEYVAPHNQIVVRYEEENLILTGIRHNRNGTYLFYDEMQKLCDHFKIPLVQAFPFSGFNDHIGKVAGLVKDQEHNEGVVVRFDTGAMIKIKADAYVRKHRSKDLCSSAKGIVQLILHNELDDVLPQLDEKVKTDAVEYECLLMSCMQEKADNLAAIVKTSADVTQKDFALGIAGLDPATKSMLFTIRKGDDPLETVISKVKKAYNSNKDLEQLFNQLKFPLWTYSFFGEE